MLSVAPLLKNAALLTSHVAWKWSVDDVNFRDFPHIVSSFIERAFEVGVCYVDTTEVFVTLIPKRLLRWYQSVCYVDTKTFVSYQQRMLSKTSVYLWWQRNLLVGGQSQTVGPQGFFKRITESNWKNAASSFDHIKCLNQLRPACGPHATQSKVLCGPV